MAEATTRPAAPSAVGAFVRSAAPALVGVGLALALHFAMAGLDRPFLTKVLMDIGISIILAVSLTMVNGFTGQFSVGHAGFMAIGAYTAAAITYYGGFMLWGTPMAIGGFLGAGQWFFVGACLAGGLVAACFGYIVGLPSLRLRGDYLAIVTLGFGEIVRVLLQRTTDVKTELEQVQAASPLELATSLGGALGFTGYTGLAYYSSIFWIFLFVAITLLVAFRIKQSSQGRAFLSVREDEVAAEAMGVNTTRYKVRAFVIAALFAGIAGGLYAHESGITLNPRDLGFQKSFDIVIMVVLGGMGSISGAVTAAIVVTVLPEALRPIAQYRLVIYALALIVMMIARPQGIFGIREIWEVGPWRRLGRRAGSKSDGGAS